MSQRHIVHAALAIALFGCASDLGDRSYEHDGFALGGDVIYEAEAFSSQRGCGIESTHRGYTGTGYVDYVAEAATFEWDEVATSAGEHRLVFRYANGSADSRPAAVLIDGREAGRLDFAPTGSWTTWRQVSLAARFTGGRHRVRVTAIGAGPNIDHMVGPPPPPTSDLYEAEDRSGARDCQERSSHPGYTGRGFMDFGATGAWIEWASIRARVSGDFTVTIRYANGSERDRSSTLVVDDVETATLPFVSTGSWDNWDTVSTTLRLSAGTHRVRIVATASSGGPNLDHLAISSAGGSDGGVTPPTPPTRDGGIPSPPDTDRIELPVEVLGPEMTVVDRVFSLSPSEASATRYLWMQVNNLSYENKGSIRINGGGWTDLNHDTVDMHAPERARGGMVHGGYSTIRFRLPVSGFRAGTNTLSFRFNRSDAVSMGFRVVRFQLLDAAGNDLLPASRFREVDPADWAPPMDDAASVARGEELWRTAPLWSHYLPDGRTGRWYSAIIPSRRRIRATCADCHTQDGRDLEIFAYSNESIVERARFHGLSREEGQLIASYIRSLSSRHRSVGRWGRPWNPPYQPGPSVLDRPVEQWAAGAGLEAVLERDTDMLPYMFPGGVSEESVEAYFDSNAMEDHTTLPIAIQLPDWKHWLPLIHPMDAYANDGYYDDRSIEFNPDRGYGDVRAFFEARPASERSASELLTALNRHWRHYRLFLSQGSPDPTHWRTRDGSATTRGLGPGRSVPQMEMAATSLARLLAVRNFELMNEFGLQDDARRLFDSQDQPLQRQWLGRDYQVFEVPAHFTGCFDDEEECQHFQGQPNATGQFETTAWYQLQLVLNGGQGQMLHNSPVDNNYHPEFILRASRSSGIFEPLRYYSAINAMWQTRTWTGATSPNDGRGMRIRVQGPWYFLAKEGDAMRNHFHGFGPGEFPALLDEITPGMTRWVLGALMRQFVREVNRPANALGLWERAGPGRDFSNALDPASKSSVVDVTRSGSSTLERGGPLWADHTYWSIRQMAEMGVECDVLDEAIDWAQAAWPRIDFRAHRSRFTAYVQLRQDSDRMVAILGNEGRPRLEWFVNGGRISESGATLAASRYRRGDTVSVRLTSDAACLPATRRSAEAARTAR